MGIKTNLNAVAGIFSVLGWICGALLAGYRGAPALLAAFAWGPGVAVAILLAYILTRLPSRSRQAPLPQDSLGRADTAQSEIRQRLKNINVPQNNDLRPKRDDLRRQAGEVVDVLYRIDELATMKPSQAEKATNAISIGVAQLEEVAAELRDPGNALQSLDDLVTGLRDVHQHLQSQEEQLKQEEDGALDES